MSKNKLKPCPFCKSPNIDFGRTSCTFGNDINIHCCDCGAKVQICEEYGEEELIKRWNTRAFDIDKVVEQLEKKCIKHRLNTIETNFCSSPRIINEYDYGISEGIMEAIEIVKAGGLNE